MVQYEDLQNANQYRPWNVGVHWKVAINLFWILYEFFEIKKFFFYLEKFEKLTTPIMYHCIFGYKSLIALIWENRKLSLRFARMQYRVFDYLIEGFHFLWGTIWKLDIAQVALSSLYILGSCHQIVTSFCCNGIPIFQRPRSQIRKL
jgi:hypothetical protein